MFPDDHPNPRVGLVVALLDRLTQEELTEVFMELVRIGNEKALEKTDGR